MKSVLPGHSGRTGSRLRVAAVALLVVAASAFTAGGPAVAASAAPAPMYYLSLGDSLAQGVQPTATGESVITDQGYADDLWHLERLQVPGLQLAKLGCPGETTTSMIAGGVCTGVYTTGTQLGDAVAFLKTHRTAFVTIDIGANNVDHCLQGGTVNQGCVTAGVEAAASDLPVILATLRAAAPGVPIFAMNYYDPFLAAWLQGSTGQTLAEESVTLSQTFNGVLAGVYAHFGVPVADVAASFQTANFSAIPFINLPINVALICLWTWMCAPAPVGPNIHGNVIGYGVIAATFARTIGRL